MSIRWIEDGEQSGWVVKVGEGRERLFLARKLGGTLVQLRFASLAVINSREDLHLQECAHAGRT